MFAESDDGGQWGAEGAQFSRQLWHGYEPGLLVFPGSAEFYGDVRDARAARPDEYEPARSRGAERLFEPDTGVDHDSDRSDKLLLLW